MSRLLMLLCCAVTLSAAVPERIPLTEVAGPQAPVIAQFHAALWAWNQATMVEAYRQHGQRDPAWDADAELLLEEWARRFSEQSHELDSAALSAVAERLSACPDPMVIYCIGKVYEVTNQRPQADDAYQRAYDSFAASTYPRLRKTWAGVRLIEIALRKKQGEAAGTQALLDVVIDDLVASLEAGDYRGMERVFVQHCIEQEWDNKLLMARYYDRLGAALAPHAETWYGATILGYIETKRAWIARGSGWGNSVTEEGWKGFRLHLGNAQRLLTKAWELAPEQPLAASKMITVAMASPTALSERQWFDRAVAAEFDHMPAYGSLMWAMAPRWGGSHRAILAFGRECAATQRFDTLVPIKLIDGIHFIYRESKQFKRPAVAEELFANQELWTEAKAVLDGLIASPAHSSDWFRSLRAAMAWRFGHRQEAAADARELGGALKDRALKLYDVRAKSLRNHQAESAPQPADPQPTADTF